MFLEIVIIIWVITLTIGSNPDSRPGSIYRTEVVPIANISQPLRIHQCTLTLTEMRRWSGNHSPESRRTTRQMKLGHLTGAIYYLLYYNLDWIISYRLVVKSRQFSFSYYVHLLPIELTTCKQLLSVFTTGKLICPFYMYVCKHLPK